MKKYLKNQYGNLLVSIIMVSVAIVSAICVQFIKGNVLDSAIDGDDGFTLGVLLLFGVIVLEIICYYGFDYFRGKFAVNVLEEIRIDYFDSILRKSPSEFGEKITGDYVAQYTNEIELVNNQYYSTIPLLIEISLKIVLVSIALFFLNYKIAILTIGLLTMPLYIPKLLEKKLQRAQEKNVLQFEANLSSLIEWLNGMDIIKSFGISNVIRGKFTKGLSQVKESSFEMRVLTYRAKMITTVLSYMSHFIILAVAAKMVLDGEFTAGEFFVSIGMIDQLSYPIISLSALLQQILSTKSIGLGLIEEMKIPVQVEKVDIDGVDEINFSAVDFSYGNRKIIDNLNKEIVMGERVLIIGESGSGKSTLTNLILGHLELEMGEIAIDGIDIQEIGNLHEQISIMRQEPFLFNDTLRNNLTMYSECGDEVLIELLNALNLDRFASVEGLDMKVSEMGGNLSGGEKKRISLGRTLLRNTPILILDEPLANVDKQTVSIIEELIMKIDDRILFLITHQIDEKYLNEFNHIIKLD